MIVKCKICGKEYMRDNGFYELKWYLQSEYCSEECAKRDTLYMNSKKMVEEFVEFLSDEQKEKFARIICDTPSEYLEVIIGDMGGCQLPRPEGHGLPLRKKSRGVRVADSSC